MLKRKNGGGSSMISTGIVGTPFQSYSPKSARRILQKTLALAGPPIARIRALAKHGRIVRRDAGHLHREVDLDRRGEIGGAALEEAPPAVRVLPTAQEGHRAPLDAAVDAIDEAVQQEGLGGQRAVGLELADPVTIGRLAREEVVLDAGGRLVESRHDPKC